MKIYKNPWVTRESYFVKTGAARSAKMEAAKSTGYSVDFWDGKWKVRKATYYNKSLDEMPVVCENKVSIQAVIEKAVLDAVRGFAGGGKSDGEETPQAGWLPVDESEITGWDPALAGHDPIGGYACSKCGYEAVYSCNDEYVLSDYCPGCGARMDGGETPHMMAFDPAKWGDMELERWNGVVTAMRVKMHQYMGCAGTTRCPEECRYKHMCAWTRDVQIMCGKELNRRSGDQK